METNVAEYNQVKKYEGFYIGRYEAGVATYNEETKSFENSVTFSNNATLEGAVGIQTGINSSWWWQNYDYTARQEGTIVTTGSNKVAGNVVSKANSIPYYHADYYTAVEMTRRMYENHKYVTSVLITGTRMGYDGEIYARQWCGYSNIKLGKL